ncbi:MAG: TIGR00266 family protein [Acidobacteriota bacterium]
MPAAPGRTAHEIDFRVFGEDLQFVEVELDPGESAVAEAGGMMYMTEGIEMNTVFGDGSESSVSSGIMGKLLGAGKRLLTGESLFMTIYTNAGHNKQHVAFAAPYAGKIVPMDLTSLGGQLICQKDSFLCAARGVSISIAFQKKIGVGLFGGEGFIMQRLEGDGLCFVHAGGTIHALELAPGQKLRVDTGCLVALQPSVSYDIQFVGKVKTALFGGEGIFFASLTGPGKVWLQSLPLSRLADRIYKAIPSLGRGRKGEGSVLDAIGIGNLIDGD